MDTCLDILQSHWNLQISEQSKRDPWIALLIEDYSDSLLKAGWSIFICVIWTFVPVAIFCTIILNGLESNNYYSFILIRPILILTLYLLRNKIADSKLILRNFFPIYLFFVGVIILTENILQKDWRINEMWFLFHIMAINFTLMIPIDYK